jgi:hypothetical protein
VTTSEIIEEIAGLPSNEKAQVLNALLRSQTEKGMLYCGLLAIHRLLNSSFLILISQSAPAVAISRMDAILLNV